MVERVLAKDEVAGSSPVSRSIILPLKQRFFELKNPRSSRRGLVLRVSLQVPGAGAG